jgi:hypothetical protein
LFLGANIDAFAEAVKLGIPVEHASGYAANRAGINSVYAATAMSTVMLRRGKKVKINQIISKT